MTSNGRDDGLFERLRERALPDAAEAARELGEEQVDVVSLARGATDAAAAAPDLTLGGYVREHSRPPAFEGVDGEPYSVDVEVQPADNGDGYVAFLVFIRWAGTGAGIMDHVESDDVATGTTEEEAKSRALELPLHDVKAALDAAIARRRRELE